MEWHDAHNVTECLVPRRANREISLVSHATSAMTNDNLPTVHLATLERMAIARALDETGGNRVRAALRLGIHVRTLHRKLRTIEAEQMQEELVPA